MKTGKKSTIREIVLDRSHHTRPTLTHSRVHAYWATWTYEETVHTLTHEQGPWRDHGNPSTDSLWSDVSRATLVADEDGLTKEVGLR